MSKTVIAFVIVHHSGNFYLGREGNKEKRFSRVREFPQFWPFRAHAEEVLACADMPSDWDVAEVSVPIPLRRPHP